ncbi:hypothetical protein KUH03_30985 [Sphingobacterium sp. E70]|uniref:hypothetical protein n=1 Tax=Sphingobacterium sp. E70 TaxID=2853439 RepID=UPI00211CAEAE|nr:hypothetical protein [Sphingobacterium sp. E70]ULT23562.1 hypothetical protein KUH03_30985 [Sphingobacterium sp. E70]
MRVIPNKTRTNAHRGNEGAILFALHQLYRQLHGMRTKEETADSVEAVWWDAVRVQDYVGLSERSLYRYQHKGMLGTVRKDNGKRLFLASAVEHFKRAYWNL